MFSSLGVIFLLLGTASVFTGVAVGSAASVGVVETATPTPAPEREVPNDLVPATALRTCSIASLAADPRLLTFQGSVINITTGEVLYDRNASGAAPPASGLKVMTAAAALMTIGPSFQMSTRVFEGSEPGSIVLVGGGDPTLSRLPAGVESVYSGAPKLADLAAQTIAAWNANHPGEDITKIILDASYWNPADKWDPTWDRVEQRDGWQSEVTALMVDGDRDDPQSVRSRRSDDPISRAGVAFESALGLSSPAVVVTGNATPGLPLLGEVRSQPMATLIAQMLQFSDNSLGENIARVVSKEWSGGGSSASIGTIIPGIIANLGLDTRTITVRDGSGLSASNLVPPVFMAQLMAKVAVGEQELGVIKSAMPVAGKTGSLRSRFTGSSEIARGQVFAKTGWINGSRTLSGWLNAQDGSVLSFAFYALGPVQEDATVALDAVTTGAFMCGNNLSNN
jgi:D-alanyl-D-alanine carboxypeptidase/D-alanyl-D-alanine-endopeptidase (penicillin-binding protein 4)